VIRLAAAVRMRGMSQKVPTTVKALGMIIAAILLGVCVLLLIPAEARSHTAAIRNQYIIGRITLEDAQRELGNAVDTSGWPEMKAEWQRSHNADKDSR
jgi:hypothetical protein